MILKSKRPDEPPPGAPDWMVTFSDCMTLLLTFFVLMVTFSSFEKKTISNLGLIFAEYLPYVGPVNLSQQDTVDEQEPEKLPPGSENRTLSEKSNHFIADKTILDYTGLKVFTVTSGDIFLAKGYILTSEGRTMLDILAKLLAGKTDNIIISHTFTGTDKDIALERACAVLEYLTTKANLEKNVFGISIRPNNKGRADRDNLLEITLLERGTAP